VKGRGKTELICKVFCKFCAAICEEEKQFSLLLLVLKWMLRGAGHEVTQEAK
jgi:hypothetical protein